MSDLERPRSGLSVASSVATISSVNQGSKPTRSVKRVHTFGKREYAIKRDPNSAVVIRGWLYKQDSAGLRLWKRRWFVLSDFCLFYYRDSREETVLGSILLPSYAILQAGPREAKNRKFTFKAEHPGMRTYYFGADTQEDMNGWIRAMNQSALVVAENNKMGHLNNLSSSSQDGYYASYEDFTRAALAQNGEHAKSAESLEIAHLSETRSQQNSSSDSLLGPDRGGDGEGKAGSIAGTRDPTSSSSEDVGQFTPGPQHGTAPPSTPICGVKKVEFNYDLLAEGSERLVQRKESISQVQEWVCLQKEKLLVTELQESICPRSPSGQVPKAFENPHEVYPAAPVVSYAQTVSPSSPMTNRQPMALPEPENHDLSMGGWERKEDGPGVPWSDPAYQAHNWLPSKSPSFIATSSPPTERAGHVGQAPLRASRTYSLPPTPSELSRHRAPPVGSTPDEHTGTNTTGGRVSYYSVAPHLQKSRPAGPPHSPRDVPDMPRTYHQQKVMPGRPLASSCEELNLIGSYPSGRTLMRPHTPMGRVDMHPSEDLVGSHFPILRHSEEKPPEVYTTSSRSRGQLMRSSSRPQTPADRYDVLPSDDTYSTVSVARLPGHNSRYPRRSQHPGQDEERLGDGYSMILGPRAHGPASNRLQVRVNTPIDRVPSLPQDERSADLSLTPSLARNRTKSARYSDRTFMGSPAFMPRNLSSTPRLHAKMVSHPPPASPGYSQLPPLPPFSSRSASHVMPGKRISLAVAPQNSGMYRDRMPRPTRMAENDTDVLLTRLCGQDKLLQSLEEECARLRTDKEKLEHVLEVTRLNLAEFQGQEHMMEKIWYQQRILQDDLVHIRARLCDVNLEKEQAWEDYAVLENDLHALRETLEHVRHVGHPQDQAAAQRDLWMINDIISGLRAHKSSVYVAPEPTRHPALMSPTTPVTDHHPGYQQSFGHLPGLEQGVEVTPPRPPLPKDHPTTPATEAEGQMNGNNNNKVMGQREFHSKPPVAEGANLAGQRLLEHSAGSAFTTSVSMRGADLTSPTHGPATPGLPHGSGIAVLQGATDPEPKPSPPRGTEAGSSRKQRMSTEEQMQRMRRHQEAQLPERLKPGPSLQRQGSQRNATTNGGSQLPSPASESNPDSPSAESPDRHKPALVKVTSNYFPITLATSQQEKTKAAWFLESGTPLVRGVASGDQATAESTSGTQEGEASKQPALVVVNVTSRSSQEMSPPVRVSPPVRTSSKLVTATRRSLRTRSSSTDVQNGCTESRFEFPNNFQRSFSSDVESSLPLSPEQLEARREDQVLIKNMVSARSPGTPPRGFSRHLDEEYTVAPEGQRERIMSLSYTLATEASQRSKLMTAQALADEYSDDSVPEDAEDWDFLLQEVYSSSQPDTSTTNHQTPHQGTASRHPAADEPGHQRSSQCSDPKSPVSEHAAYGHESRTNQSQCLETARDPSDHSESPADQRLPWDSNVGCYENWTVQECLETNGQDRAPLLKREQSTGRTPGCNGRVVNCGYQLERVDFSHVDLDQMVGYLKEGEEPIRVTVLQSSF